MAFTLCTSGAATYKAGANCSETVLTTEAIQDSFSNDAEGYIEQLTNSDYTTNYATLSTSIKNAVSMVVSALIAKEMINYDMSGYTSRTEAQTMLDVNDDLIQRGLNSLKRKADTLKTP